MRHNVLRQPIKHKKANDNLQLWFVCVGSWICHTKNTTSRVGQIGLEFIFERFSPVRFSSLKKKKRRRTMFVFISFPLCVATGTGIKFKVPSTCSHHVLIHCYLTPISRPVFEHDLEIWGLQLATYFCALTLSAATDHTLSTALCILCWRTVKDLIFSSWSTINFLFWDIKSLKLASWQNTEQRVTSLLALWIKLLEIKYQRDETHS